MAAKTKTRPASATAKTRKAPRAKASLAARASAYPVRVLMLDMVFTGLCIAFAILAYARYHG